MKKRLVGIILTLVMVLSFSLTVMGIGGIQVPPIANPTSITLPDDFLMDS